MDCPPWWRVYIDGYGGQNSLGGESYEGAVGSYLFVCCSTGSTDARLYASHEQFPVALHQFLRRVESEHFKVQMIYVDTFSVNISVDVEEVCALSEVDSIDNEYVVVSVIAKVGVPEIDKTPNTGVISVTLILDSS